MKRKFARTDANHGAIVKALRGAGCSVQSLASVGSGVPDLLVARNGHMWLLEVKDGTKSPSAQKLTADETLWRTKWKAPVYTVCDIQQAMEAIWKLPAYDFGT